MARKIIPLKREKHEPKLSRAEQSQRANRTILRRTLVLMVLFGVVVFIPLIVTLYNLMIRDHDYYEAQAIDNQTRYTSLSASRGQIFDRNMNVLAASAGVENVLLSPVELKKNGGDVDRIAEGLGEILNLDLIPGQSLIRPYETESLHIPYCTVKSCNLPDILCCFV